MVKYENAGPAKTRRGAKALKNKSNGKQRARKKLFVVLGMHRSGTSVIARGLSALGIELGDRLMPPAAANNAKGFFEDLEIVDLNQRILASNNSSWDALSSFDESLLEGEQNSELRAEALALISEKISNHDQFGIKDPRLSVLMPFWRRVLEDLDVELHYVITVRNPLASAQSLQARDELDLEKGIVLWGKYMFPTLKYTSGQSSIIIDYDEFLSAPFQQLQRIAKRFDLGPLKRTTPAIKEFLDDFVDQSLRHQSVSVKDLRLSTQASRVVIDLFDRIRDHISAESPVFEPSDQIEITDLLARFKDLEPLRANIDKIEKAYSGLLQASNTEYSKLAKKYETASKRSSKAISELQSAHDSACHARDETLATLNELARDHSNAISAIQSAHDAACLARDEIAARLHDLSNEHTNLIEEFKAASERASEVISDIQSAHDDACRQRDDAYQRRDQALAALNQLSDEHSKAIETHQTAQAHLQLALDQHADQISLLTNETKRQQIRLDHNTRMVAKLSQQQIDLRNSTSWKITAPLRIIARGLRPSSSSDVGRLSGSRSYNSIAALFWRTLSGSLIEIEQSLPPSVGMIERANRNVNSAENKAQIGIIIHAFYPELFNDIVRRLDSVSTTVFLYVTAPPETIEEVHKTLSNSRFAFRLIEVENRGRDIAPFLESLRALRKDGLNCFLKLHTKVSPHLANGDAWRTELFDDLITPSAFKDALNSFNDESSIGIVAPRGHILSVGEFQGANRHHIKRLCEFLNIELDSLQEEVFVAGSMFFGRVDLFLPLLESSISMSDFEPEDKSTDGTLAHALERMVGILASASGARIAETGKIKEPILPVEAIFYPYV